MSPHWFKLMQKRKFFIMVECQLINVEGVMGLEKREEGKRGKVFLNDLLAILEGNRFQGLEHLSLFLLAV